MNEYEWTAEDEAAANAEGWCISNSRDGCHEIQRLDELDWFSEDQYAIAHVYWMARTGSELHRKAIMWTLRPDNKWSYAFHRNKP